VFAACDLDHQTIGIAVRYRFVYVHLMQCVINRFTYEVVKRRGDENAAILGQGHC
jgi:hypothetical protein